MERQESRRETLKTKARYDRIAPLCDTMEVFVESAAFQHWRDKLWSRLPKGRILELGVGTGKNMSYYPQDAQITSIDLSDRMLAQANKRMLEQGLEIDLVQMDAQHLGFPADIFDAVVASFVFCSVLDPVVGLRELARVARPRSDIWLLDHVRINEPIIGEVMDVLNLLVVPVMGANINRRTVENVEIAGLEVVVVENLLDDLVKLIHGRTA